MLLLVVAILCSLDRQGTVLIQLCRYFLFDLFLFFIVTGEFVSRTDFLWKAKLKVEQEEVETMRGINKVSIKEEK